MDEQREATRLEKLPGQNSSRTYLSSCVWGHSMGPKREKDEQREGERLDCPIRTEFYLTCFFATRAANVQKCAKI